MGKLALLATDKQKTITNNTMAILVHNGRIYKLSYSDTHKKYDTTYSQDITNRIFSSFSID